MLSAPLPASIASTWRVMGVPFTRRVTVQLVPAVSQCFIYRFSSIFGSVILNRIRNDALVAPDRLLAVSTASALVRASNPVPALTYRLFAPDLIRKLPDPGGTMNSDCV